jgi:capsid protein
MTIVQNLMRDSMVNVRTLASRGRPEHQDQFAAAKSGIDSIRSAFYGSTGRLPNTRTDSTRKSRSLSGGPGDRHMSQLDLWTEREISRFLRDESTIFDGMIQTWAAEVIQNGFRMRPDTGDITRNKIVNDYLFGWDGDSGWCGDCDARGMMHFWDLITLSEETELTDGDHAFYLDPDGCDGAGSVSIIEGDRILTPAYGTLDTPGRTLINGVEMDQRSGKPTRFWIADEAPAYSHASSESGRFYPAFDRKQPELGGVLFSVDIRRYTATRRQPWLSSAVRAHDEIDDVFVAVRIALRNIACRSTITEISDYDAYMSWLKSVDSTIDGLAPESPLEHTPSPGDHNYTNPGEVSKVLESDTPGDNFDPFMQLQINMLGLGLGMCIEESARIFQKSFSASRMAVESTRRRYERRQKRIKRRKVDPIIAFAVARAGLAGGGLDGNPLNRQIRCWYPGWPYMEPLKDAKASETLVASKLRSRRTCAEEIGDDWELELAAIQEEQEQLGTITAGPDLPPDPTEGDTDGP